MITNSQNRLIIANAFIGSEVKKNDDTWLKFLMIHRLIIETLSTLI